MMQIKSVWYYEAKIALGATSVLPALLLPAYALLGLLVWTLRDQTPSLRDIWVAYEVALPLAGALIAAHLMSTESEYGFDELRRSYPEASWRKPVLRWLGATGYLLASALLTAPLFALAHGSYNIIDAILPALPPALFTLSLSLLLNAMTGNYWVVAALMGAYWFMEFLSQGQVTEQLYLFARSWGQSVPDYDLNRALFVVLTALLLLVTILWSAWQRRRGG